MKATVAADWAGVVLMRYLRFLGLIPIFNLFLEVLRVRVVQVNEAEGNHGKCNCYEVPKTVQTVLKSTRLNVAIGGQFALRELVCSINCQKSKNFNY